MCRIADRRAFSAVIQYDGVGSDIASPDIDGRGNGDVLH